MDKELFGVGKTFIGCMTTLILTWLGIYLNMWDPSLWEAVLWPVLATLGVKSVGQKAAKAYGEKNK